MRNIDYLVESSTDDIGIDYKTRNQHYFPQNITIQDCRNAIRGVDGFRETVRNGIVCFNYDFCTKYTFPTPYKGFDHDPRTAFLLKVRRECRGLLFSQTSGKLICRKLHKFFNINEMEETNENNIDLSEPYVLLEKIDGSLVAPMLLDGVLLWGSKSGPTEISARVERYQKKNPNHLFNEFAKYWLDQDCTPMFEWTSLQNQIILPYEQDCLTLLSIRNMLTGDYILHDLVKESAEKYQIPIAKVINPKEHNELSKCETAAQMIDTVKKLKGVEGYIIKFHSGKTYKMKTDWYFNLNHTSEAFNSPYEKDIWNLVLSNQLDDTIAKVSSLGSVSLKLQSIQLFAQDLFEAVEKQSKVAILKVIQLKVDGKVRKHLSTDRSIDESIKKVVFQFFDTIDEYDKVDQHISTVSNFIIEKLKQLTHTKNKIDDARKLLGNPNLKFTDDYIDKLNNLNINNNNTTITTTTTTTTVTITE
ncbi:hypothetical protein DLAC_09525 [Tieghemostelium lacteum]|uniref:T4 RNA ligase 1-like N-terminal domain-containing protein n=1 Tax=Tieghemostelium lacteum TaxID=361077 RepID=A0A151Z6J1_TIELA|nr:hypothetical protein DLAC_09525 [Tieghemostelium lacteum]|eukprot:KYQ89572.1 hypothetical protein DLAC_09525 [Tieghemostelium lacteum]